MAMLCAGKFMKYEKDVVVLETAWDKFTDLPNFPLADGEFTVMEKVSGRFEYRKCEPNELKALLSLLEQFDSERRERIMGATIMVDGKPVDFGRLVYVDYGGKGYWHNSCREVTMPEGSFLESVGRIIHTYHKI